MLVVLLVGWVPSILLAYISYTTLTNTLESKVLADAQSITGFLSKFVEDNLARTGETMDYYRTLPRTIKVLKATLTPALANPKLKPDLKAGSKSSNKGAPKAEPSAQEWLSGIYYSQTRIDGLFLTDVHGKLMAAVPQFKKGLLNGQDYASKEWLAGTLHPPGLDNFYISPAYIRPGDGRLVASIVVAIKDHHDNLLGYLGADTLIERLGRRLAAVNLMRHSVINTQLIDQNGYPLFGRNFSPNQMSENNITPKKLWQAIQSHPEGGQEVTDQSLYFFQPIERANWTAVLEEPVAIAHQAMHDMRSQNLYFALWLILITTGTAYVLGKLYQRQLQARFVVEREQIFNEKILANMPVGIAMIDQQGSQLLQTNGSFQEIIRSIKKISKTADFHNIKFSELNIAPPDVLQRVLRFGIPFQAVEQKVVGADGSTARYLTTNLLRLQDSYGHTLGVLCLIEDRSADVRLRQELIDANAAKDQFLAVLSHELRTPLSPVITMVTELELITAQRGNFEERRALEIIRRNVELEARLIDDLLDITRITSGKLQLKREFVDVHQVLSLALEITQQDIVDKYLQIDLQLGAKLHFAYADLARLQQVFWNLIKNAVKFTPIGKRIIVRTSNHQEVISRLELSQRVANRVSPSDTSTGLSAVPEPIDFLQIEVIDEGIGIAHENIARIFNAFDQGQSQITRQFGGLGLGLAISKAMIEAHGGSLNAYSEGHNQGASFVIEIEAAKLEAVQEELAPVEENVGSSSQAEFPFDEESDDGNESPFSAREEHSPIHLLLVDDHLDTCFGMQLLLTRRGYEVTLAHSVTEALACIENQQFDLIVSDIGLPDGSGNDLIRTIRVHGGPQAIALSGFGMESDIEKAYQAGFDEHLTKPVDIDRLDNALRRLTNKNLTKEKCV